jgi:acyl carrier protein
MCQLQQQDDLTLGVLRLFSEALYIELPAADLDLVDAGLLDSLTFVELLVQLERRFGTVVAAEDLDLENFRTARRIADYVARSRRAA